MRTVQARPAARGDAVSNAIPIRDDETLDDILGGRRRILQKARGYRYSLDALLLARFVSLKGREAICDLGTGSGIIPIILADRWPDVRITGVEIQGELAEMARRSVALGGLASRIAVMQGDVRHPEALFAPCSFDVVTANPPYRRQGSGRINPLAEKAVARHEILGSAASFLAAAAYALRPGGRVFLIYPASRLVEVLTRMRRLRLEPKRLQIVYATKTSGGTFALVEGIKEGGEELAILPPFYVHEEGGGETTVAMRRLMDDLSAPPEGGGGSSPGP